MPAGLEVSKKAAVGSAPSGANNIRLRAGKISIGGMAVKYQLTVLSSWRSMERSIRAIDLDRCASRSGPLGDEQPVQFRYEQRGPGTRRARNPLQ